MHIITNCWELIYELNIAKAEKERTLFNVRVSADDRFQIGPITLLDKLARHGFHLVAQNSTSTNTQNGGGKKYLYWTCKKDFDSEDAKFEMLKSQKKLRCEYCVSPKKCIPPPQAANPECSSTDLDAH